MAETQITYFLPSEMKGFSVGLYNGSRLIRNQNLMRNNGKYSEYKEGISSAGGEMVGEGYAVSPDFNTPQIREGGLYNFTHSQPEDNNLLRNKNILAAFYDYEESALIENNLSPVATPAPWNDKLYGFSDVATQENSVKFTDYRDYAKSIFRFGLSFETNVKNGINSLMFNGYTPNKTLVNDVTNFIDGHQGTINDPVPIDWSLGDTHLGYIGKQMVHLQKYLQSGPLYEPITEGLSPEYYSDETERGVRKRGNVSVDYSKPENYGDSTQVNGEYTQRVENSTDVFRDDTSSETTNLIRTNNLNGNRLYKPNSKYVSFVGEGKDSNTPLKERKVENKDEFDIDNGGISRANSTSFAYNYYDEGDRGETSENPRTYLREFSEQSYDERIKSSVINGSSEKSLLEKTRRMFANHKIDTLLGRFHTSNDDNPDGKTLQETQTALSDFGLSHGRNLLKKSRGGNNNGYSNPYCRVWTYHHQYSRMDDLIRPFGGEKIEELQANYLGRPILGFTESAKTGAWSTKTTLNKNAMVNIAPTREENGSRVDIKQCMFSIENLAWKDMPKNERVFPESEIGPLGGRIMWFPPYDLNITETSQPEWERQRFIGRGESVFTYSNTERSGTLSFTIVADHPSVIDYWMKNHNHGNAFSDKDEAEQDLLRFFAGCANLDMSEMSEQIGEEVEKKVGEEERADATVDPKYVADNSFNGQNGYAFYLYFPNNLSGKDYLDNPEKVTDYLMLGKHKLENIKTGYTIDGKVWEVYDENIDNAPDYKTFTGDPWGYETGKGKNSIVERANLGLTDSDDNKALEDAINSSLEQNKNQSKDTQIENSKFVWGYGKDRDTSSQRLCAGGKTLIPAQYFDIDDFGFNASRYSEDDPEINCSFMDAYIVIQLQNKDNYSFKNELIERITDTNPKLRSTGEAIAFQEEMYEKLFDPQKLNSDEFYTTNGKKYKRKIHFAIKGGASGDGYDDKNDSLAKNRKTFLKSWINKFTNNGWIYEDEKENNIPVIGVKTRQVSDVKSKEARRARIVIWWADEEITETVSSNESKSKTDANSDSDYSLVRYSSGNDYSRYGNEFRFFKELKSDDNILYRNIIDKIKYFDPAFHAITPEGFNGRLAFLHQCTRMGPTVESSTSANKAGYAGNLAFGRAPVCVLRLGDFYNTRIVITSLNINYDTSQWDLNPEGIGVQPILAKINIGFTFQGGSSLGGPVTRLQNAISFNYYANQEVYEDRADVMVYDDSGNTTTASTIWDPWDTTAKNNTRTPASEVKYKKSGYTEKVDEINRLSNSLTSGMTTLSPQEEIMSMKGAKVMSQTCSTMHPETVFTNEKYHESTIKKYEKEYLKKNFLLGIYECGNPNIKEWADELLENGMVSTIYDAITYGGAGFIITLLAPCGVEGIEKLTKGYYSMNKKNIFSSLNSDQVIDDYVLGKAGFGSEVKAPWIIAMIIKKIIFEDTETDTEKLSKLNKIGYICFEGELWPSSTYAKLAYYNDKEVDTIIKTLGYTDWRKFLKCS